MPLPFNKTLDLKLLALVKENSILYNTKHPRYLDFDAREVVWQKIGDALNRSGKLFHVFRKVRKGWRVCFGAFALRDFGGLFTMSVYDSSNLEIYVRHHYFKGHLC